MNPREGGDLRKYALRQRPDAPACAGEQGTVSPREGGDLRRYALRQRTEAPALALRVSFASAGEQEA